VEHQLQHLINHAHTYRDLLMRLDSHEKRMFDAIDGRHRICTIAEEAEPSAWHHVLAAPGRAFFEKLWWYDRGLRHILNTRTRPVLTAAPSWTARTGKSALP
jgi:hypothetical protein